MEPLVARPPSGAAAGAGASGASARPAAHMNGGAGGGSSAAAAAAAAVPAPAHSAANGVLAGAGEGVDPYTARLSELRKGIFAAAGAALMALGLTESSGKFKLDLQTWWRTGCRDAWSSTRIKAEHERLGRAFYYMSTKTGTPKDNYRFALLELRRLFVIYYGTAEFSSSHAAVLVAIGKMGVLGQCEEFDREDAAAARAEQEAALSALRMELGVARGAQAEALHKAEIAQAQLRDFPAIQMEARSVPELQAQLRVAQAEAAEVTVLRARVLEQERELELFRERERAGRELALVRERAAAADGRAAGVEGAAKLLTRFAQRTSRAGFESVAALDMGRMSVAPTALARGGAVRATLQPALAVEPSTNYSASAVEFARHLSVGMEASVRETVLAAGMALLAFVSSKLPAAKVELDAVFESRAAAGEALRGIQGLDERVRDVLSRALDAAFAQEGSPGLAFAQQGSPGIAFAKTLFHVFDFASRLRSGSFEAFRALGGELEGYRLVYLSPTGGTKQVLPPVAPGSAPGYLEILNSWIKDYLADVTRAAVSAKAATAAAGAGAGAAGAGDGRRSSVTVHRGGAAAGGSGARV